MSETLVERLARKWDDHVGDDACCVTPDDAARWWLRAIAEEVEDAQNAALWSQWGVAHRIPGLLREEAER